MDDHERVLRKFAAQLIGIFSMYILILVLFYNFLSNTVQIFNFYTYCFFITSLIFRITGFLDAGIELFTEEANKGFVLLHNVSYRASQSKDVEWNNIRVKLMNDIDGDIDHVVSSGRVSIQKKRNVILPLFTCNNMIQPYSTEFYNDILHKRCYFGCRDFLVPNGSLFFGLLVFPKGLLEDFTFYLMNHHQFLSMILATHGHPYSRYAKMLSYYVSLLVTFFVRAVLLATVKSFVTKQLLSIFIFAPLMRIITWTLYYLFSCPCLYSFYGGSNRERGFITCINLTGKFITLILANTINTVFGAAALIIYINHKKPPYGLDLLDFACSVQLLHGVFDFFMCFKNFWIGSETLRCHLCGWKWRLIGKWYEEYVEFNGISDELAVLKDLDNDCCTIQCYTRDPFKGMVMPPDELLRQAYMNTLNT